MTLRIVFWLVAYTALWVALAGPSLDGWYAAALGVAGATAILALLQDRGREERQVMRPAGALRLLPHLAIQALGGGIDVARRALSPSLPLAPGLIRYSVRLPPGPARTLFVNTISLLPGTFSAELVDDQLRVHLLARSGDPQERLQELEARIAGSFGLPLAP